MSTQNYSSDEVNIAWTPLPGLVVDLKEGVATGSFITEAKTAPRYTKKSTGTGKIVRVRNPDRSGSVTVTVDQESETHRTLTLLMLADDITKNHVGPLVMTDGNTGQTFVYKNAFIENEPDEARGTDSATFAWVFGYEAKIPIVGPANANIVGS